MDSFTFGDAALAIGGIALFLLGVRQASKGLSGLAGGRLKIVLSVVTTRRVLALFTGTLVTFLLQSSTASTVMLVGLCNVGLLTLYQAAGVALGNCIGSTLIVQLIAFDVSGFALLGVAAGLALGALAKHRVGKSLANVLIGFGLLFYGIPLIRAGLAPIHNYPAVENVLLNLGTDPGYFLLGIVAAALLTVITQSSAATVAVAFALARGGVITLTGALPFIFGAHLATFVTPLVAAMGSPRLGKQVVLFDFGMRAAGVLIFAPFSLYIVRLAEAISGAGADPARIVAWQHTVFNVANALIVLPLLGVAVAAVQKLLPMRERLPAGLIKYIDPKFLDPLPIALEKARKEVHRMGLRVADNLEGAVTAVEDNDLAALSLVRASDDATDLAYEVVADYLTKCSAEGPAESKERTNLLYILKNIEHAGDIVSKDIVSLGLKKESLGKEFSIEGGQLLRDYLGQVRDNFVEGLCLVLEPQPELARGIMENETKLNVRRRAIYEEHLEQIRRGVADAHETSSVYTDLLAALQQITRCAAEIAETVIGVGAERATRAEQSDPQTTER